MIKAQDIISEVTQAVNSSGKQNFYLQGIDEVMDYKDIVQEINQLSFSEAFRVLSIVKNKNQECKSFVEYITEGMLDDKFYQEDNDIFQKLFHDSETSGNFKNETIKNPGNDRASAAFNKIEQQTV